MIDLSPCRGLLVLPFGRVQEHLTLKGAGLLQGKNPKSVSLLKVHARPQCQSVEASASPRGRCASRALADETAPLFEGGPRPGGVMRHTHQTLRFRLAKNTGQTTSSRQQRLACVKITRMRALRRVHCIT